MFHTLLGPCMVVLMKTRCIFLGNSTGNERHVNDKKQKTLHSNTKHSCNIFFPNFTDKSYLQFYVALLRLCCCR